MCLRIRNEFAQLNNEINCNLSANFENVNCINLNKRNNSIHCVLFGRPNELCKSWTWTLFMENPESSYITIDLLLPFPYQYKHNSFYFHFGIIYTSDWSLSRATDYSEYTLYTHPLRTLTFVYDDDMISSCFNCESLCIMCLVATILGMLFIWPIYSNAKEELMISSTSEKFKRLIRDAHTAVCVTNFRGHVLLLLLLLISCGFGTTATTSSRVFFEHPINNNLILLCLFFMRPR